MWKCICTACNASLGAKGFQNQGIHLVSMQMQSSAKKPAPPFRTEDQMQTYETDDNVDMTNDRSKKRSRSDGVDEAEGNQDADDQPPETKKSGFQEEQGQAQGPTVPPLDLTNHVHCIMGSLELHSFHPPTAPATYTELLISLTNLVSSIDRDYGHLRAAIRPAITCAASLEHSETCRL